MTLTVLWIIITCLLGTITFYLIVACIALWLAGVRLERRHHKTSGRAKAP